MEIPPEKLREYIETARRREVERHAANEDRRQRAIALAQRAAVWLKEKHAATRVTLYGSALQESRFDQRSDIDLAVWGLPSAAYYRAWNEIDALDDELAFDLVRFEEAKPHIRQAILAEGVDL